MRKSFLAIVTAAFVLSACGVTTNSSSAIISSDNSSASSEESQSSSTDTYQTVSWDNSDAVTTGISLGDPFIDTNVGYSLAVGESYRLNFSFTDVSKNNASVTSNNTGVLSVAYDDANGVFSVTGVHQGQAVLVIKDSTGWMHYRNVISVKNAIDVDHVDDFLSYNVDHFVAADPFSKATTLKISFLGEHSGVISGKYDTEGAGIISVPDGSTFTYTREPSLDWPDDYAFTISTFSSATASFNPKSFILRHTGEVIHLYNGSGNYMCLLNAVMA
jgi:hypothetical protein